MDNLTAILSADPAGEGLFQLLLSKIYSNFAVAIIILLAGIIIGRLAGRMVEKILEEIELNRILKKASGIRFSIDEIIANFITYIIYFVSIILALDQIGVASGILHLISFGIILVIITSILLGVRDFFPNILSGIFIAQRRHLSRGDHVKMDDIEGEIIEINIVETRIRTKRGDIIYIPNSILTKREIIKLKR